MQPILRLLSLLPAFSLASIAHAERPDSTPRKKLIEMGWDIPNTVQLREHWQEMEAAAPFDGLAIEIVFSSAEGKGEKSTLLWSKTRWSREQLAACLADLQSCKWTRFTDNFLLVDTGPGDVDWFDDEGYGAIAAKMGLVAWLAKSSGAKGVMLDPECYSEKIFQFNPKTGYSFPETSSKARQRGAEIMRAITKEYPDMVLLSLWLNSLNLKAAQSSDPEASLETATYGLFPAFFNGLLDAAPGRFAFIDGNESAYRYEKEADYLASYNRQRQAIGGGGSLIAPENKTKFRRQVTAGFGFYLDMFLNPPGNAWYFGPADGGSRLGRLASNLGAAVRASDEYVWVYGEQCHWWPWPMAGAESNESIIKSTGKGRQWEEAMPGISLAIDLARDPVAAGRAELERRRGKGTAKNLLRNADFHDGETGKPPANFGAWQDDTSKGRLEWDAEKHAARAKRVTDGCFLQAITARAGQHFAVSADAIAHGASHCTLVVRWQRADGSWVAEDEDRIFIFEPGKQETKTAFGVVEVPDTAQQLLLLLNVEAQRSDEDACWFSNAGVYEL